jgi:hypothetical protein
MSARVASGTDLFSDERYIELRIGELVPLTGVSHRVFLQWVKDSGIPYRRGVIRIGEAVALQFVERFMRDGLAERDPLEALAERLNEQIANPSGFKLGKPGTESAPRPVFNWQEAAFSDANTDMLGALDTWGAIEDGHEFVVEGIAYSAVSPGSESLTVDELAELAGVTRVKVRGALLNLGLNVKRYERIPREVFSGIAAEFWSSLPVNSRNS